jgi:hypothetical protein
MREGLISAWLRILTKKWLCHFHQPQGTGTVFGCRGTEPQGTQHAHSSFCLCGCFSVVLENHVVTDDDEPALKRQRLEINCQDPSIKVPCGSCGHCVTFYHQPGLRIAEPTLLQLCSGRATPSGILRRLSLPPLL